MHALTLRVDADAVDAVSELLAEDDAALAVSIEDADAGTPAEQPVFDEPGTGSTARWRHARISALFADEAGATAAAATLAARSSGELAIEAIAAVDDLDWVRLTQAQFGPTEIDAGFWIVPSWSPLPEGARRVLRLDPGMAFGTGTHPTTRMCLRWIARQASTRGAVPWASVLDYGCGSGVLAIAAGLCGAAGIEAVDIDPAAVEATRANATANGVAVAAGLPDELGDGRHALVVANILATPLKLLASLLAARLERGGELLLSGILATQAADLQAAYAPWLAIEVVDQDDGWILMAGRAPGDGEARVA